MVKEVPMHTKGWTSWNRMREKVKTHRRVAREGESGNRMKAWKPGT